MDCLFLQSIKKGLINIGAVFLSSLMQWEHRNCTGEEQREQAVIAPWDVIPTPSLGRGCTDLLTMIRASACCWDKGVKKSLCIFSLCSKLNKTQTFLTENLQKIEGPFDISTTCVWSCYFLLIKRLHYSCKPAMSVEVFIIVCIFSTDHQKMVKIVCVQRGWKKNVITTAWSVYFRSWTQVIAMTFSFSWLHDWIVISFTLV